MIQKIGTIGDGKSAVTTNDRNRRKKKRMTMCALPRSKDSETPIGLRNCSMLFIPYNHFSLEQSKDSMSSVGLEKITMGARWPSAL